MLVLVAPAAAKHLYEPDAKLFPDKAERYGAGLTERYLGLWKQVGPEQAGNNLVIDGQPKAEVAESAERMDRWLHPPPAPATTSYAPEVAPVPSGSASSGYSIPSDIVECESGGDYGAVNPSSGAYGAYQILPSTSSAYGCDMSTAAGQDACAAEIYSDVGSSAWVC